MPTLGDSSKRIRQWLRKRRTQFRQVRQLRTLYQNCWSVCGITQRVNCWPVPRLRESLKEQEELLTTNRVDFNRWRQLHRSSKRKRSCGERLFRCRVLVATCRYLDRTSRNLSHKCWNVNCSRRNELRDRGNLLPILEISNTVILDTVMLKISVGPSSKRSVGAA